MTSAVVTAAVATETTVTYPQETTGMFKDSNDEQANFGVADIVIVVVYMLATFFVGIWASCSRSGNTVKSYFLAGKHMSWLPVGASLFASNIGSGHFIGLAGAGAAGGIAIGSFEWIAPYQIIQLGWMFLPIYTACKVYTMPEYLHRRFGGARLRVTLSVISLALYVLTKIAVDLYAGALFIQQAFNINMYLAIVSLLVVTAVYTILGGLKAVIYTDTMQTVVMLAGGMLLMVMSFIRVGGYESLKTKYMQAIPQSTIEILQTGNSTSCGIPREDSFHIFRDPVTSDLPWPGMILGIYFLGSWYWCTDQVIVQRALAAKSSRHAKAACVMAGVLKIIPMYMIVMTGMISRVFFPDEVACATPSECDRVCGNKQGCSNIAYPKLVIEILPTGLRGLMVAAMLSALMSSLTSIFNSTSTIFTIDVWKRIRKGASQREMLIVGKLTVCVLVVISILWIPVILSSAGGQLFLYLQSIQSALGPPIFALYLFGILWPRINEKGAFWGLLSGFTGGVIRLVLDFYFAAPGCDQKETRPSFVHRVNYLHVAPIVFLVSCVITIAVSYATDPLPEERLHGTTWFTKDNTSDVRESFASSDSKRIDMESNHEDKTKEKLIDENKGTDNVGLEASNKKDSARKGVVVENEEDKMEETQQDEDDAKGNQEHEESSPVDGAIDPGYEGDTEVEKMKIDVENNADPGTNNRKKVFTRDFYVNALAIALAMAVTFLMGFYA